MKRSEIQELRLKPKEELERLLRDSQIELRGLRFNLAAGKLKNVGEIRKLKKTIDRKSVV